MPQKGVWPTITDHGARVPVTSQPRARRAHRHPTCTQPPLPISATRRLLCTAGPLPSTENTHNHTLTHFLRCCITMQSPHPVQPPSTPGFAWESAYSHFHPRRASLGVPNTSSQPAAHLSRHVGTELQLGQGGTSPLQPCQVTHSNRRLGGPSLILRGGGCNRSAYIDHMHMCLSLS